jgi:hypothetical protein
LALWAIGKALKFSGAHFIKMFKPRRVPKIVLVLELVLVLGFLKAIKLAECSPGSGYPR